MKKRLLLGLATALIALVTACGGGGGGSVAPGSGSGAPGAPTSPPTSPPGGGATAGPTMQFKLTITIPGRQSASKARTPQYIAPTSGSMTMTLLSVNGTTVQSAAQGPFNLTAVPSNTNCATVAGVTTCTFTISAPVGTDIFLANTFSTPDGSGNPLGGGSVVLSVRQNATNSANLSLTGPVTNVQLVSATTSLYNGNPIPQPSNSGASLHRVVGAATERALAAARSQSAAGAVRKPAGAAPTSSPYPFAPATTSRIFVIALDAVGNQIINPTTFDIPITLKLSLNGLPAGAVTLAVTFAGLPGETGPPSTSSDQGTITVWAPSDIVTLTASATTLQTAALAPTVVADFTPQLTGTPTTSAPLTYSVFLPPAAAVLNVSASHVDPFTTGVAGTLTDGVLNIGTASTSGQIEASSYLYYLTYNNNAGSDPSWVCTPTNGGYYYFVDCFSNAVVPPNGTLPLVFNVTPTGASPADNQLYVYGGGAVNGSYGVAYSDSITVNNVPTPAISLSVNANGGTFYATVPGVYTINVINVGSAATTSTLTMVDTLPNNFSYTGFSGPGWNCSAASQTITCTYPAALAVSGSAPVTLNVTPTAATVDTSAANSASISGGGASAPAPVNSSTFVSSPVTFSATGFNIGTAYGNTFAPGDGATLNIGAPPPSLLVGSVSITTQSAASSSYSITSNTCSGSVIDGAFATPFPVAAGAVGSPVVVPMDINATGGPAGPCGITIQDAAANTANITISVNQPNITIQGHRQKPGGTR